MIGAIDSKRIAGIATFPKARSSRRAREKYGGDKPRALIGRAHGGAEGHRPVWHRAAAVLAGPPVQCHQYTRAEDSLSPTIGPQFADQSLGKCPRKYPM